MVLLSWWSEGEQAGGRRRVGKECVSVQERERERAGRHFVMYLSVY